MEAALKTVKEVPLKCSKFFIYDFVIPKNLKELASNESIESKNQMSKTLIKIQRELRISTLYVIDHISGLLLHEEKLLQRKPFKNKYKIKYFACKLNWSQTF